MAQQPAERATGAHPATPAEGAETPNRQAVASGEVVQPTPTPDQTPSPSRRNLADDEDFRKYDANMQRKLSDLARENRELRARQQQQELATVEDALRSDGLDDKTISARTMPLKRVLFETQRELVLTKLGMSLEDVEPADYGGSMEDFEANMRRKKDKREHEETLKQREADLARREREAAERDRVAERDERRQSGADRQPRSDSEPSPGLEAEWRAEVKATKARGGDVAAVNAKYRRKGLKI
jgi:hypothetical protein